MRTVPAVPAAPPAVDLFAGLPPIFRLCANLEATGEQRGMCQWRPMHQAGYVYATDGRVCVRSRITDLPPNATRCLGEPATTRPELAKVFDTKVSAVPTSIAGIAGDGPLITCPDCGGSGLHECPTCEHQSECGQCDGSGQVKDMQHISLTSPTGVLHKIAYYWLRTIQDGGITDLHLPVRTANGGRATFRGEWQGIPFDGVVVMLDPKSIKDL